QQSGATFDELIGASGNGVLVAVGGGIQLDPGSLLDIELLNGFTPTDGETFDIMDAVLISGTFANAPTTGFEMDGFDWTITYDPGEIVLDAVSPVSGGGGGGGTNVPEPSSFVLLVAAMIGLGILRIWRRRVDSLA
ncbi:MAG TPA: PEP-CTERM sorting domain-containing protein, partial [Candidatus Sulfotelmatobacter sp.]|nr:PEP-CTERM sorting domain-containing protein [Candidatus Sulfotelmatobacter sp.]